MSLYVLNRIQYIKDKLFYLFSQEIDENVEVIEEVEKWFEDENSLICYRKELVYKALDRVLSPNLAIELSSPFTAKDWENAIAQTKIALEKKVMPHYETGMSQDSWQVQHSQTTTFILNQYNYKDIVSVRDGDIVLDCGACFGETALWSRMYGAKKVYSFEPNPDSFQYVQKNAELYDTKKEGWFIPVPFALGRETGTFAFQQFPDHPGASHIQKGGNIEVPVTTLDLWCEENKIIPDFIKMDLEGAEVDTLLGAQHIFQTYKPRFAICLYHRLSDMWTIPHLLKHYCPEYRFWCKKSAPNCEFVLFGEKK